MKQSTKRLVSSVLALLFIGGAFMVFLDFIKPVSEEIGVIRGEQASRQQFIETQKSVVDKITKLTRAYDSNTEFRDAISLALPLNPDISGAMAQLHGLAGLSGITALGYSAGTPALQGGEGTSRAGVSLVHVVGGTDIQLKAQGTYEDLKKFLTDIETNIRLMDIKSLGITPAGKPGQSIYAYDITVATYYQSP